MSVKSILDASKISQLIIIEALHIGNHILHHISMIGFRILQLQIEVGRYYLLDSGFVLEIILYICHIYNYEFSLPIKICCQALKTVTQNLQERVRLSYFYAQENKESDKNIPLKCQKASTSPTYSVDIRFYKLDYK